MPGQERLLGIDLGAGSLKTSLVTVGGEVVARAERGLDTRSPRPGWREQSPQSWWHALVEAVGALLAGTGTARGAVSAVAVSGGAHIAVLTDARGRVIRPAILWSDMRSEAEARDIQARLDAFVLERALNRANPTWSLCQLMWLARHEPRAIGRVRRVHFAKDYLRFRLTGQWCTDPGDATGSLMWDHGRGAWSQELVAETGLDPVTLPPLRPATEVAGTVSSAAARATGLAAGTPVVVGSIDTTVELAMAGALRAGEGAVKLASAGVVYRVSDAPRVDPPVSCYPHLVPDRWYQASGINACASAHRWLRDLLYRGEAARGFEVMDREAAAVAPGAGGLLFHPYLMGERAPHWDPGLRGDFLGLTLEHTRAHLARACYEGIAFALRDVMDDLRRRTGEDVGTVRIIGGGARSDAWCGIIADVTGCAVQRPRHGDASFASALLAGVGAGRLAGIVDAVRECVRVDATFDPDPARAAVYDRHFEAYDEARRRLTPIAHSLHGRFPR